MKRDYYITNVALATTNVASKTTALISQIAAASVSSGTYGFSLGAAANISGTQTNTKNKQTISSPSNLNALNIRLTTNKDKESSTNITGSNLLANNNIDINTKDLNINSSQDRFESDENSKALSGSAKFTMYGGGGGSLGLDHSQSNSYSESITNNNSKLISNKDININTTNDTTIKGANLRADGTLNLKVGNNLSLESLRDRYTSNQKDFSISAGVGFSGNTIAKSNGITTTGLFDKNHFVDINTIDKSSTNANFSRSRSNTITKQTILSSITANELNVEVGKNTHLKGSLLAAGEYDKDNTFIDNHNLNLKTNTLSYENLSNTSYAKGTNFSIGANYILEDKNNKDSKSNNNQEDKFTGLKSIDLSNHRNLSYSLSKNLATLGSGNIEIADKQNSDDLTRLNRDTTKLTKDLVNTSISSNVDASIDARVLTKSGQKEMAKEITSVANSLDNLNRYIKDSLPRNKLNEEKANEIYKEISNNGLRETIVNIFKQQGLDNEQIENLMSDRDIISLIKSYNTISSKTLYSSTDNLVTFDKDGIPTINVTNTKEENFYDFVIKGAKAIDTISKAIGESNAVAGIFVIQVATQGLLKTAISVASNEVKDNFTKGIKEGPSEYIANDLLDINNKGNDEQRKKDIKLASDLSASVSIDILVGGAYSIVKGSKNVVKADEKLKESNVNSNAIAKSNADLKRNEHNLNNKNSSDGVAESDIKATSEKIVNEFFDIKNINTFKNANIKDVEKFLDKELQGWTKEALKKGDGVRYYDGKGGSFELNKGYANPKDDIHGNPYLKATVGSEKVRIPLK